MSKICHIGQSFYDIGIMVLFALVVVGCTTKQEYETLLNSWLGSAESELVTSWGPPDGFYEDGHKRYLTWSESSTSVIAGIPSSTTTTNYGGYVSIYTAVGTGPIAVNSNCNTTMIVESDKVVSWRYKGNSCYDF